MNLLKQITPSIFLYVLLSMICVTTFSCQETKDKSSDKEFQEKRTLSFSEELEIPDHQVQLLTEAKKEAAKWLAYITAQAEINRFKKFTIQDAVDHSATLKQIMNTLEETVPRSLQIKPVQARVNVLVTLSSVLKQKAEDPNSTAEEIEKIAEKIPVAFNNLKIQFNEVYRDKLDDYQLKLLQKDTLKKPELEQLSTR